MFFAPPISPSWLLSKTAAKVYGVCAALAAVLVFQRMLALVIAPQPGSGLALIIRLAMLPAILGVATLLVAMLHYWFCFHPFESNGKIIWFFVLTIVPYGTCLYYWFVYRKSPLLASAEKPAT